MSGIPCTPPISVEVTDGAGLRIYGAGDTIPVSLFDSNLSADDVPYPPDYAKYKGVKVQEKVVRFDPPHLLAFTFEGENKGIAEFAIFPEGERTRLVLTHTGVTQGTRGGTGAGWHSHLAVLEAKLSGGEIRDFWALHKQSEAAFAREDEQA